MLEVPEARPESAGLSSERLARIRPWMRMQVDERKLAGLSTLVIRHGRVVWYDEAGDADVERRKPMARDTIVRIYSMTKPLTSVAVMMLYEEGRFQLDDPLARFLPVFSHSRVVRPGGTDGGDTVAAERGITVRDLLTHTSGLSYGFLDTPVAPLYRDAKIDFGRGRESLEAHVGRLATLPLLAQPGSAWNYSVSTDVLGRFVEVLSGQTFETFLQERVIGPLGMVDTSFTVPDDKLERFAACYGPDPEHGWKLIDDPQTSPYRQPKQSYSGGGGLVGTIDDYGRFCRMMLNKGEIDGVRLLGRKTVELMTSNHLRGDMAAMGAPRFSESSYYGIGFGLGFSVMLDPPTAQILGTRGEYAWGGMASTAFWIDPAEDMAVVFFTQLIPSSTYAVRRELRVLTYQAVID